MRTSQEIALNTDWWYLFAENLREDYSEGRTDEPLWIPLPTLFDWAVGTSTQTGVDWFRREIVLDAVDEQYILCIDKVPVAATVYINGQYIGDVDCNKTFSQDITPLVAPGVNVIVLKLTSHSNGKGGVFGGVCLLPIRHLGY